MSFFKNNSVGGNHLWDGHRDIGLEMDNLINDIGDIFVFELFRNKSVG